MRMPNFIPVWRHTAEVLDFSARVTAAGGAVSFRTMQCLDKFVIDARESGVWSCLKEVLPLVGSNLNAALVKLKYSNIATSASAVNFVSGDFSEATGLLGDGATKHLDLHYTPANLMTALVGLASYNREDTTGASIRYAIGVNDLADNYLLGSNNPATACAGYIAGPVAALPATPYTKGFYYVDRSSSSNLKLYRDGVEIGSNSATVSLSNPGINFFAFARNNNGGGAANYLNTRVAFLAITTSMPVELREVFYRCVQTLQVNLGRAV